MSKKTTTNPAKPARKPHNARTASYGSFGELLTQVASEPRKARMGNAQVTMPRSERLLRVMLASALSGKVRDVAKLLGMMAKNPALAATFRSETVTVLCGSLARL